MDKIDEPTIESTIAHTIEEAAEFAENIGYPVVIGQLNIGRYRWRYSNY